MIEYRFRIPNAAVFTLYSYSKALEYPLEYPLRVVLKGLEQAAVMGLQHVILETDATVVANGIGGNCIDRSVLSTLFREIRANVLYDFATCSISRCPRECNLVAHSLADMGIYLVILVL
jgi:hypothetical protein